MLGPRFPIGALRSIWLLTAGLLAANLGVIAFVALIPSNERMAPPFAPVVRWEGEGWMGRGPIQERRLRTLMRTEIQQAVAVQGDERALERLHQFYRRPFASPSSREGVSPLLAQPAPPQPVPHRVLRPFGLHRSGPLGVALYLASLLSFLILSFILLGLFPRQLRVVQGSLEQGFRSLVRVGAVGILGYGLIFLLVTLLTLLVVGIPLAALLFLALVPLTFFGLVALSLALGRWLEERVGARAHASLWQLVLGILLLFPLGILPLVSWPVIAFLACLGFGAVLLTKFGSEEGWTLELLEESPS